MHHFIVRNGQHEILRERVQHAEGDVVVMILAVDGILTEIIQHVVHPAHVPLHGEPEAVQKNRARHAGECSGFLGNGHRAGNFVRQFIEAAQQRDGFQVLVTTVDVREPNRRLRASNPDTAWTLQRPRANHRCDIPAARIERSRSETYALHCGHS